MTILALCGQRGANDNPELCVGKEMQNEKASNTDPRFPDAGELVCGVQRQEQVFSPWRFARLLLALIGR
jgi:hypothetical protein